jgi:hypothetical protein
MRVNDQFHTLAALLLGIRPLMLNEHEAEWTFGKQSPSPQPSCYTNLNIPAFKRQAKYDFKWLWYIMGFVNVC